MRGGARKGAGRKFLAPGKKLVAVSYRVRPEQAEKVRKRADTRGCSANQVIRDAIDKVP